MSYKKEYWTNEQVRKFFTELKDASLVGDDTETYHNDGFGTGVYGVSHTESGGYAFIASEKHLKDWQIANSGVTVVVNSEWEHILDERIEALGQE